jgi:hypothetical protein
LKGKVLVLGIVIAGLAVAGGTVAYWRREKAAAARALEDDARRAEALVVLLRANRLRGHAKERGHDARAASPGRAYVKAGGPGGVLHVVRAAAPAAGGGERSVIYVFREDGSLAGLFEDAEAHELDAGGGRRVAVVLAPAPGAPGWVSIREVTEGLGEALRIRGPFRLETTGGAVTPRAPRDTNGDPDGDGDLPLFRHDPASGRFRGPPGGPDERWEVDGERSPGWEP